MSDSATALASSDADQAVRQPLKLNVTVEKASTCQRRVKVSIPREDIDRHLQEAVAELMPSALLPGFRPGRAPRSLVSSRFKTELRDQIRSKLLTEAMAQVTEQEKLSPISEPDLDVGAVVTLLGRDGEQQITAEDWSQRCGTIPWEILCGFKHRLPRLEASGGEAAPG